MGKLILLRHGQSVWNKRNLFTGWVDIPLSVEGIQEALNAGEKMADLSIDVIFTSSLIRAQMTVFLAMSKNKSTKVPYLVNKEEGVPASWTAIYSEAAAADCIPVFAARELNERMYGQLQGLNKQETIDRFGADQVKLWRRSYDTPPPGGESLAMTASRAIPYFQQQIVPYLEEGKTVFVSAHGNSLRAIIMLIDNLTPEQVVALELATGEPVTYRYENRTFHKSSLN